MSSQGFTSQRLESTVRLMCDLIIQGDAVKRRALVTEEYILRNELVACLLSSQVRSETADSAMAKLNDMGLLSDDRWSCDDHHFEKEIIDSLTDLQSANGKRFSYRFPVVRARQLSLIRTGLRRRSLQDITLGSSNFKSTRQELMNLPGIGPKHASMFLRNAGVTYDLAILDAHVLNYLAALSLVAPNTRNISALNRYEKVEQIAVRHSRKMGHAVGVLDWAIWITMQAAKELKA